MLPLILPAVLLEVPLVAGEVEVLPLPACCVVVEVVVVVVVLGAAVVPEAAGAELAVELPLVAPGVELVLPATLPVEAPVLVLLVDGVDELVEDGADELAELDCAGAELDDGVELALAELP